MQEKTYNLTYKQILDFQTKLTSIYNRVKCPTHWSPKETHSICFMFTDWADNG